MQRMSIMAQILTFPVQTYVQADAVTPAIRSCSRLACSQYTPVQADAVTPLNRLIGWL